MLPSGFALTLWPLPELSNLAGFVLSAWEPEPNPTKVAMSPLVCVSLMSSYMDSSLRA